MRRHYLSITVFYYFANTGITAPISKPVREILMCRKALLLILSLLSSLILHAQNTEQKPDTITSWMTTISKLKDDTNKVNQLLLLSHYCTYNDPLRGIPVANQSLELCQKLHWQRGIHRSYSALAKQYGIMNIYPTALENFNKALSLAEKLNEPKYISLYLNNIGLLYSFSGDYDKAKAYFEKQIAYNKKMGIPESNYDLLNYGNLYTSLKNYDKALEYFQRALNKARQEKAAFESITRILLDMAGIYGAQQQYAPAFKYSYEAEALATERGDNYSLALIYYNIGALFQEIYTAPNLNHIPDSISSKTGALKKMQYYYGRSLAVSRAIRFRENMQRAYKSLAETYEYAGDQQLALRFRKAYESITDSLRDISKQKEFARVEAEFKVQKTTDSLKYIATIKSQEAKQHRLERNIYVLLVALAGIITIFLVNRQRLKQMQKRKIAEELAKHQLGDFTKSIQDKNEIIEKFSAEIERYQSLPCSNQLPEKESSLQALLNSVILTEEQWVSFQALFDKVHTGYIARAKNKFRDLTPAELRFLLLSKLGLSYKEMAGILGISVDAVRVTKHRLLKKIQLPEGTALENLVHTI